MKQFSFIFLLSSFLLFSAYAGNNGKPISKKGTINIVYAGFTSVIDWDLNLYVNEKKIGCYSYKKGFSKKIPITKEVNNVKITYNFLGIDRTSTCKFIVNEQKNYTLMTYINHITGSFVYKLIDDKTGEAIDL